jgi:hypothetical protein
MATVNEGMQTQTASERIQYKVIATPAPATVTAVTVRDVTTGQDVTASAMPAGSAAIVDGAIVLPVLQSLVAGHQYRISMLYSDGVNVLEPIIEVYCN